MGHRLTLADNPWPPEDAPTIASLVCEDGERPSRAFPGVSLALSFILCCDSGWFPHVSPPLSSCGPSARLIKAHPAPGAADKQGTHCRAPTPPAGPVSTRQTGLKFLPAYPPCVSSSYFAKNDEAGNERLGLWGRGIQGSMGPSGKVPEKATRTTISSSGTRVQGLASPC